MSGIVEILTKALVCFMVGNLSVILGFWFCFLISWILKLIKSVAVAITKERFKVNTERVFTIIEDTVCTVLFISLIVFFISVIGYMVVCYF